LACPGRNLGKADRTEAPDPQSGDLTPLFNPRRDAWSDHFEWGGYEVVPRSPVGRATLAALDLNRSRRIQIRCAEELFGLFPPS
jgi:hypothetical protein